MNYAKTLAAELSLDEKHVENVIALIDANNTIPFIARYRKELTGSMDDQVLLKLSERLGYLRNLEKRREEITRSIEEQGKLTDAIRAALAAAATLTEAEDIYAPFRPRRRTRATVAREKGLGPLAGMLMQPGFVGDIRQLCREYVDVEKGVSNWEDALRGAMDVIAEALSEDASLKKRLRTFALREAYIESSGAETADGVYNMYCAFSEEISRIPAHRILAINRGEKEGILKVRLRMDEGAAMEKTAAQAVRGRTTAEAVLRAAAKDAWERLLRPSIEREIRASLTETAQEQAISTFAENLEPLLMQPPIKGKTALGLDPAYRTGCKLAVVDETGKFLEKSVIYPTPPQNRISEAKAELARLIRKYGVSIIAIGNGTASRESEAFVAGLLGELGGDTGYMVVSESGASVYSASPLAASEFPELDVSIRSAISIARRLQDPLAELVKIDPKAIGVGQYQHDLPTARLDEALGAVVERCVNRVGVDLNTASPALLTHVAGLNSAIAKNIVAWRDEHGAFASRAQLRDVPRLGPKAFEQCAGFLRIPGGKNILDNTAVHPESYAAVARLMETFRMDAETASTEDLQKLSDAIRTAGLEQVAQSAGIGLPTLKDILEELARPGRDIRDDLPQPILHTEAMELKDLAPGMELMGTVRNVADFGAFVDIGVHQDGLVHISRLSDRFVKKASDVVQVGQVVKVWVIDVDVPRKRISLSMKGPG